MGIEKNKLSVKTHLRLLRPLAVIVTLLLLATATGVDAEAGGNGLSVTLPNGYANITVTDLALESVAGQVRWQRWWDGKTWKFNSHWESLSQTWSNATCNRVPQQNGAWQWVSVDSADSPAATGPVPPLSTEPFNQVMSDATGDYPALGSVDPGIAGGCLAATLGANSLQGIRRQNELYVGQNGHLIYSNSTVLDQRAVKALPALDPVSLDAQLAAGAIALAPVNIPKGFRWTHREGDWIDYNLRGQVVAYGDPNNNITWLARDSDGLLRGVVDANGRVLLAFHYSGGLLASVSDFPISGDSLDISARTVSYQYDANNRLAKVIDVRGNATQYGYDGQGDIISITDAEGHAEHIAYTGNTVAQRIAADGGVTDYQFGFDDANQQYHAKVTGPATAAGRRVDDSTYDNSGKPVRKIVNGRTDDTVLYDTAARTETHTNARGFRTILTRNEFEQVTRIDYPDASHTQRSYSAQNQRLIEAVDEAGIRTQYSYDAKGNLLKKTEAAGTPDQRSTEYQVNEIGQITRITRKGRTEPNGTVTADAIWAVEYDAQGQVSKTTDPEGGVRQYVFDRAGNLASFTDPLNHTTRYETDADGNLVKMTDAEGRIEMYTYDKVGNTTGATDARGKATQAAYDAMNRLLQATNPVGGIAKLQYNDQGLPTSVTDEDGRTVQFSFDTFQRLTQLSDALGNQTQFTYTVPDGTAQATLGSLSLPTGIKFPTFTQANRLDARERPTSQILLNPKQSGTETDTINSGKTYDARGLITSETDANGKLSYYSYNALGQTIGFTDSLGNRTDAIYDARGNLIRLTDANSNAHSFEYDRNDRLVKETLPLGQVTDYHYDAVGNLSQRIDPNGHKTTYIYDATDWLTDIKQYAASTDTQPVRVTTLTWDAAHNLTAWSDTDATRSAGQQTTSGSATYDDANRKTGETVNYPDPSGQTYSLSYGYQYSKAGEKTRLTWADSTAIDYSYSGHGELETVTIPGEGILSVNQFNWTVPAAVTLPGGTVQRKTYDGLLNLEQLKVRPPGQQPLLELANRYSLRQELTERSRTDTVAGQDRSVIANYRYDDTSRLVQADTDSGGLFGKDSETFTLDAVGNRSGHSKTLGSWYYDANNRLTDKGILYDAATYDYDASGNLAQKTQGGVQTHYRYDNQNRLTEVSDSNGNPIARYGYDPFDRRLWKEQYRNKNGAPLAQAQRSYYLYADEGLIAVSRQNIRVNADQSVSASTEPVIATQYGPRPDSPFGTGALFVKTQNSNGDDSVAYYHHDHLDTPIQATDKAGNIVWSAQYQAFGRATITTPTATFDAPTIASDLRFPGQVEDAETGLYYNWRRYYDPELGRYITGDPIGLDGGINLYAYVGGNPVNLTDPTGNCPLCIAWAAAVGVGIWNAYDTAKDVADTAKVFGDSCSSDGDKAKALGWLVAGVIDPTPGNMGKKVINSGASNAKQFANLKEHLRQAEKYGQGGVKELQNSKIRYYGETIPARSQGEMAGRRTVREWDPATGNKRTWHETLDHNGNVRQVRPEFNDGTKTHYTFDQNGNYTGRW